MLEEKKIRGGEKKKKQRQGTKVDLEFYETFGLASTSAIASTMLKAPISRIQTVVQVQGELIKRGALQKSFAGVHLFDCGKRIIANEGFVGLWRSNFVRCFSYFPTQALNFTFKPMIKSLDFLKKSKDESTAVSLAKNVAAGGLAGGTTLLLLYPLSFAQTHLATDLQPLKGHGTGQYRFSGIVDVYKRTLAPDHGARGLFRGFGIGFAGIFMYRGFYFGLYDTIMPRTDKNPSFAIRFAIGYAVTMVAGILAYPTSTIQKRMIVSMSMKPGGDKSGVYSSSLDCASKIMKTEGLSAFFKGWAISIPMAVVGGVCLAAFNPIKKFYVTSKYGDDAYV